LVHEVTEADEGAKERGAGEDEAAGGAVGGERGRGGGRGGGRDACATAWSGTAVFSSLPSPSTSSSSFYFHSLLLHPTLLLCLFFVPSCPCCFPSPNPQPLPSLSHHEPLELVTPQTHASSIEVPHEGGKEGGREGNVGVGVPGLDGSGGREGWEGGKRKVRVFSRGYLYRAIEREGGRKGGREDGREGKVPYPGARFLDSTGDESVQVEGLLEDRGGRTL